MITEFIRAFIMIFIAEMGDKSQILAMTFATKYNVKKVFIGLFIGILSNHLLAVLIGVTLNDIIPLSILSFLAGILFVVFGLYSLKLEEDTDEEIKDLKKGPIITIAVLFFIGELGDKTQLTAITLASDANYPILILCGTVIGMMVTSLLGIYIGIKFGKRIPVKHMKIGSSFVFLLFGGLKIYDNSINLSQTYIIIILLVIILSYILILIRFLRTANPNNSLFIATATKLRKSYMILDLKLEDICLGIDTCKSCIGNSCLIGYTKQLIKDVLNDKEINIEFTESKTIKEYDHSKVKEALDLVSSILKKNIKNPKYQVLHIVRNNFEIILYKEKIDIKTWKSYISTIKQLENKRVSTK